MPQSPTQAHIEEPPLTVLVAQHNAMLCAGVCQLLRSQPDFSIAGIANDTSSAVALARRVRPDLLLLEIELPGTAVYQVLELLGTAAPSVRTLLFGAAISNAAALRAMRLGARGMLLHAEPAHLLFRSLRAVATGQCWVPRALVNQLARQVQLSTKRFGLTLRERQVTALVVSGCSNREIAQRCHLSAETVKHHLTSIFAKTGVASRVALAVFALHHGIAGRDPDDPLVTHQAASTTSRSSPPPPRPGTSKVPRTKT